MKMHILVLVGVWAIAGCDSNEEGREYYPTGWNGSSFGDPDLTGDRGPGDSAGTGVIAFSNTLDPDDVLVAAVLVATCIADDGVDNWLNDALYERSERWLDSAFVDAIDCLSTDPEGCQTVTDCRGWSMDLTGPCFPECQTSTVVACDDSWKFSFDCATTDRVCDPSAVTCVEPGATSCSSSGPRGCVDGAVAYCSDGYVRYSPLCSDYGLACVEDPNDPGWYLCMGDGGACTSTSFTSALAISVMDGEGCVADDLVACVNGAQQQVDCSSLAAGFSCQQRGNDTFCGLAADCDPDQQPFCSGAHLVVCNSGRFDTIDCAALGFTGCDSRGMCAPAAW